MELEAVRIFVKVAELGSFTHAADHLGTSKARVSLQVQGLEAELGCRLLQRTTRAVRLTADGEQLLARARRWVQDADELMASVQAPSALRGQLRVDLPVNFARDVIIPRLPEFLAAHPHLEVLLSTTDRRVDLVREGFDCTMRVGPVGNDGSLTARRLGMLSMINCASAEYLRRHGTPRTLDELDGHLLVHYAQSFGGAPPEFEYPAGDGYESRVMRSLITVNSADAYLAACAAGLGIIQAPRAGKLGALASGELVEILPGLSCAPMPVSLVHVHGRRVPQRVRAVLGWLAQVMAPYLDAPAR